MIRTLLLLLLLVPAAATAHDPCSPDIFDADLRQCVTPPPPPVDSDGDGIPDDDDLCPNEGDQGHGIDADGCPIPPPPPPPPPPVGSELACGPEGGGSNFYYGAPYDMPPYPQTCPTGPNNYFSNADHQLWYDGRRWHSHDIRLSPWVANHFYVGRASAAPNDMAGMAKVLCDGAYDRWVQAVDAYSWDPSFSHWSEARMVLDSDDTHWLIADVIPDNVTVEIRGARVVVEDYTGVNLDNIQVHSSASMVDIVGQGCTE